jgi:hypothetical protein
MMVKVQTEEGFAMFDGIDHIDTQYEDSRFAYSSCSDDHNFANYVPKEVAPKIVYMRLTTDKKTFVVRAYSPVWIMNNNGKTVDTI